MTDVIRLTIETSHLQSTIQETAELLAHARETSDYATSAWAIGQLQAYRSMLIRGGRPACPLVNQINEAIRSGQ